MNMLNRKIKRKYKKHLTEVSVAKGIIKGSVQKLQRVLDLIRHKQLPEAFNVLASSNYAASKKVAKLVKSAAFNAYSQDFIQEDGFKDLHISEIWASKGLQLRRMKAGPKGRSRPIKKVYSKVFVELAIEDKD